MSISKSSNRIFHEFSDKKTVESEKMPGEIFQSTEGPSLENDEDDLVHHENEGYQLLSDDQIPEDEEIEFEEVNPLDSLPLHPITLRESDIAPEEKMTQGIPILLFLEHIEKIKSIMSTIKLPAPACCSSSLL
jgi:hypothetical protein